MRWYYPDLFSRQTSPDIRRKPEADRRCDESSQTDISRRHLQPWQPTALYTYYAIVSLVVVALAISLIWIPFVQLIAESNAIISKVLIYTNRVLLGNCNFCGLNQLGDFFNSQHGLVIISFCCLCYLVYLASAELLIFVGCYIYNLPNLKYLRHLKELALDIIEYLLCLTGQTEYIMENETDEI